MDTIKLTLEELELLIEVMERNRIDNDNENTVKASIYEKFVNKWKMRKIVWQKKWLKDQKEEVRLMPNPTSAEHIE